jgi:hypothetical protein
MNALRSACSDFLVSGSTASRFLAEGNSRMKYGRKSFMSTIPASVTTIPTYANSGMVIMMSATVGRSKSVRHSSTTP